MSKVFVIPDVHLKPWMFEKASALMEKAPYDAVVLLGDLVDDWYQEKNIELYNETFDAAIAFTSKHRDTFWCYGNHDVSYLWEKYESGYSPYARDTVVRRIAELEASIPLENSAFIHRFDNTIFSHAGLTRDFVLRAFKYGDQDLSAMIANINKMTSDDLWRNDSPIWARPQFGRMEIYSGGVLQVVGHTPVSCALHEGNLLTLDNFSTYREGGAIGDERFVWVDTVKKTWEYVG